MDYYGKTILKAHSVGGMIVFVLLLFFQLFPYFFSLMTYCHIFHIYHTHFTFGTFALIDDFRRKQMLSKLGWSRIKHVVEERAM